MFLALLILSVVIFIMNVNYTYNKEISWYNVLISIAAGFLFGYSIVKVLIGS